MTRRLLAAVVAAVALAGAPGAQAAPAKTTARVATTLAGAPVPGTYVTAAWSVDKDRSDRLSIAGFDPPGCTTTVTATWQGSRRGDRTGEFLQLFRTFSSTTVAGSSTHLRIEYRVNGVWQMPVNKLIVSSGTVPGSTGGGLAMNVSAPAAAHRTVAVRVTVEITYPYAALDIDETFRVLP
jgi:hypothetical protein